VRDGIPVEGWVFASIAWLGGRSVSLETLLFNADFVFRSPLSKTELELGISRLMTRGLIAVSSDLSFTRTPLGDALLVKHKDRRFYDFILKVDAELSSQPLDKVVPWVISDADFDAASQRMSDQVAELGSNERIYRGDPAAESLLRLIASRQLLGHIHSWDLPPIADQLLSSGVYSDAIFEISVATHAPMSDLAALLRKALQETGVAWPTREEAAWLVARWYITQIAASTGSPISLLDGLSRLVTSERTHLNHELDASSLLLVNFAFTEEPGDFCEATKRTFATKAEHHAALDLLARRYSREWLRRHSE
jgi:hypothetical protein